MLFWKAKVKDKYERKKDEESGLNKIHDRYRLSYANNEFIPALMMYRV